MSKIVRVRCIVEILVLGTVFTAGGSVSAQERAPGSASRRSLPPLRVRVAPEIEDAKLIPGWIFERHTDIQHGLTGPRGSKWIDVEITGATYDYRVVVSAWHEGTAVGPDPESIVCECTTETLLEVIDEEIEKSADLLQETAAGSTRAAREALLERPSAAAEIEPDRRRRMGRLEVAGMSVALSGVAVAGLGLRLALHTGGNIDGPPYLYRDYYLLGIGTLAGGSLTLATGVTLLTIGALGSRRAGSRRRGRLRDPSLGAGLRGVARRVRPHFVLGRRGVGFSLESKF